MKNIKKGFTLIELLVVVLIIGILAAIAVPQYQQAVLRSRAAEIWAVLPTVRTALEEYCLANGYSHIRPTWEDLSVTVPRKDYLSFQMSTCSSFSDPSDVVASATLAYGPRKTVSLGFTADNRKYCYSQYSRDNGGNACRQLGFTQGSSWCHTSGMCSGSYYD